MWFTHTMEHHSALKGREIRTHADDPGSLGHLFGTSVSPTPASRFCLMREAWLRDLVGRPSASAHDDKLWPLGHCLPWPDAPFLPGPGGTQESSAAVGTSGAAPWLSCGSFPHSDLSRYGYI